MLLYYLQLNLHKDFLKLEIKNNLVVLTIIVPFQKFRIIVYKYKAAILKYSKLLTI
jgi:hypothetical protein